MLGHNNSSFGGYSISRVNNSNNVGNSFYNVEKIKKS